MSRWLASGSSRKKKTPLIWIHAASAGETLSAIPVARALARKFEVQFVHSYSSQSAHASSGSFPFLHSDFIPPDRQNHVRRVLRSVNPAMIIFSRGDVWPVFTLAAAELEIPLAVISAEMSPRSRRMSTIGRHILGPAMSKLSFAGVTSRENATRWRKAGANPESILITGDTRHEYVLSRDTDIRPAQRLRTWARDEPVLLAGSTHRPDERMILKAFQEIRRHRRTKLLLAPHDPGPRELCAIMRDAMTLQIEVAEWDAADTPPDVDCLLLNRTGLLRDLYAACDLAYVGGGFATDGLHSVIEPAVYGVPVVAGSRAATRDFNRLVSIRGGIKLVSGSPEDLVEIWTCLCAGPQRFRAMGLRARSTVEAGAVSRSLECIEPLLGPRLSSKRAP